MPRLHSIFFLGAATTALLFALSGCNTQSHLGGDDSGVPADGGGEACGSVTCGDGLVCCNASCGVCAAPGVACTTLACEDGGTPPPPPADGGAGEACGPVTCGEGTVCCNASCGICVTPGLGCPAIACVDAGPPSVDGGTPDPACEPMDAVGDGLCDLALGFAWNGSECRGLSGCTCVGADCGILTSFDACQAAHVECPTVTPPGGPSCGGFSGESCGPGEYCDYPDGSFCGGDDSLGVCVPWADPACIEIYSPVCGCDGVTYDNSCFASAVGQDVLHTGVCSTP